MDKNLPLDQLPKLKVDYVFTDIDDTLTLEGRLEEEAFSALWRLFKSGIKVIPVTGRPAGWCELIARQWPVYAVVGENGAFYFKLETGRMQRFYAQPLEDMKIHRQRLQDIQVEILSKYPQLQIASDQFCRLFDLAVDFCEDVSRQPMDVAEGVASIFRAHGAQAKISSIHVNGWFGSFNKLTTCEMLIQNEMGEKFENILGRSIFVGDSPNDEPMFERFPNSFGVANIRSFLGKMKFHPAYISDLSGGKGFAQIAQKFVR